MIHYFLLCFLTDFGWITVSLFIFWKFISSIEYCIIWRYYSIVKNEHNDNPWTNSKRNYKPSKSNPILSLFWSCISFFLRIGFFTIGILTDSIHSILIGSNGHIHQHNSNQCVIEEHVEVLQYYFWDRHPSLIE